MMFSLFGLRGLKQISHYGFSLVSFFVVFAMDLDIMGCLSLILGSTRFLVEYLSVWFLPELLIMGSPKYLGAYQLVS